MAVALALVHHEAVSQQPAVLCGHRQRLDLFSYAGADLLPPRLTMPWLSVTPLLCELSFTPARKLRDSLRASCRDAWSACSSGVVFRTS